jgi:riboflavin synthase
MFSGIVEEKGLIKNLVEGNEIVALEISCSEKFIEGAAIGHSVSVDGVCLTITGISDDSLCFDAVQETLNRTLIGAYNLGSQVNLESSLKYGGPIGGHLMSGHIQLKGKIKEVLIVGDGKDLVIDTESHWSKYLSEKGYIGINGCSITIGQVNETRFKIHLIPETLRSTNLENLVFDDEVNLEIDQNTIAVVDTTERVLSNKR